MKIIKIKNKQLRMIASIFAFVWGAAILGGVFYGFGHINFLPIRLEDFTNYTFAILFKGAVTFITIVALFAIPVVLWNEVIKKIFYNRLFSPDDEN